MSRSGYSEDYDPSQNVWRGAVASAISGFRGQAFLQEMRAALEALSEKKLIARDLEKDGAVCAIGAVGKARGVDMTNLDPEDAHRVAEVFGIAPALAREIVFMNDECVWDSEGDDERYRRMRFWVERHIRKPEPETNLA